MKIIASAVALLLGVATAFAGTMAELKPVTTGEVRVDEVGDYVFGGYTGELSGGTHADLNPRRALVVRWGDFDFRFVFWHEASYCPWFELKDGAGVCFQFFEGNDGWAELFNQFGRMERNSFVDVIESGPDRVWVRWVYFGVNQVDGKAVYRGTEDFYAYPNGLVVRRQTFRSLMPGDHRGYAREPIEMIGVCPVGKTWKDVLEKNSSGEGHALVALDPFSGKRYDVWWKPKAGTVWASEVRRDGCAWKEIDDAKGVVLGVPMTGGTIWCAFGEASGYPSAKTRIKEHSHTDTGGIGWGSMSWDHWPVGWLNSQAHEVDGETITKYPNHFSPAGMDLFAMPNDEAERGEYWSVMGIGKDVEGIRGTAREWLEKGDRSGR